jgi:chemotaxis response regulator CheB
VTSASKDHRIRVLLVEMPRMLGDIVTRVIRAQPDMLVVGGLQDRTELTNEAARFGPDVIVLGTADAELPTECLQVLQANPGVRVLVVAGEGRRGFLWELRPQRQSLGEVSPDALVDVIRASFPCARDHPARPEM